MFDPSTVILVPTQSCNLRCPHCFVASDGAALDVGAAEAFVRAAAAAGVTRLGFSGGEPFLRPDFLNAMARAAVELGLLFDRLMTNGCWYASEGELRLTLGELRDAGYDGVIGLSFDAFHGQAPGDAAGFARAVFDAWRSRDALELVCVADRGARRAAANAETCAMLERLGAELGARAIRDEGTGLPRCLRFGEPLKDAAVVREGADDELPISWIGRTPERFDDPDGWDAEEWFDEDYCEGPGQVLYVHGNGDVAACCGYANEERELVIGNLRSDDFTRIMANARRSAFLRVVYKTGLRREALRLEAKGHRFPGGGRTGNECLFCRYFMELGRPGSVGR